MRKRSPMIQSRRKALRSAGTVGSDPTKSGLQDILWRLDRLERQVKTLSELVRDHAEDADRLVRIVGEDHEALRRQLLLEHEETLRIRKRARGAVPRVISAKMGFSR